LPEDKEDEPELLLLRESGHHKPETQGLSRQTKPSEPKYELVQSAESHQAQSAVEKGGARFFCSVSKGGACQSRRLLGAQEGRGLQKGAPPDKQED